MSLWSLLGFVATILPFVFTPGPDFLFIASQSITGGRSVALRANLGVVAGYVLHSVLAALGIAAVVATSPLLFEAMRWAGVAYIAYLAVKLIRSAFRPGQMKLTASPTAALFVKGFFTSFLNPKGLLVYFSILPQFIDPSANVALQAGMLSATFIACCGSFYLLAGLVIASMGLNGTFTDRRRRYVEGIGGGLLIVAAGKMATY